MRALLLLLAASRVSAQSISGDVEGLTDYRFRGVSRSEREPAAQAALDVETRSGLFGTVFGTTSNTGRTHAELDVTSGYTHRLGPLNGSAAVTVYAFPGGRAASYEMQSSLSYALATATATAGLNYAPDQTGLPRASRYAYANLQFGIPTTPLTLTAHVGDERGGMSLLDTGRAHKLDWRLGGELRRKRLAFSLAYVATDLPTVVRAARPALVAGMRLRF